MNSIKYLWVGLIVVVLIAVGGYLYPQGQQSVNLGAAGTRFPSGISANTNSPSVSGQLRGTTLLLDTSNSATSTAALGCIQTYATSTATAVRFVIGSIATSSTSYTGTNTIGLVGWQYGTCPI